MEEKYKYAFLITSYNRYDMLTNMLNEIDNQIGLENIITVVVDDCSTDERYNNLKRLYRDIIVVKTDKNNGVNYNYKTFNTGLDIIKEFKFEQLIYSDDDMELSPRLFEELDKNTGEHFVRLFVESPYGKMNWGYIEWVDGAYCVPYSFLTKINFKIDDIPQSRFLHKDISTGVMQQITIKLNKYNYKAKHLGFSLCEHLGNVEGKLQPEHRLNNPIVAYNFIK
jgi:glycosyltransferase involved in cell wall biosynthesis